MRISWERTSDGQPARRHESSAIAGPHVQPLAWQAFTDLVRLRARFAGNDATYAPVLVLLAKHCNWAAGWSVLARESAAAGEGGDPGPDLCLRTCLWDNAKAMRGISAAGSAREYIATSLPLKCAIRFTSTEMLPVAPLVGQTAQILSAGVRFERRERVDQGGEIDFRFTDALQHYRFTYFPATAMCSRLEGMFAEWHAWFEKSEYVADQPPDDACSISYGESVWERLERYS